MRIALLATFIVVTLVQFSGCGREGQSPLVEKSDSAETATTQSDDFAGKLEAAMAINDVSLQSSALAAVAIDAAAASQHQVAKSAIEGIREVAVKNQTAATAALKLAACKKAAEATEIAKLINDVSLRNATLSKVAKGENRE